MDKALDTYQQALVIRREVGDRSGEGTTLNNIGVIYDARGQMDEALDYYQQALAIRREVGDRSGEGTTLNNIGEVYARAARWTRRSTTYQQALAISPRSGRPLRRRHHPQQHRHGVPRPRPEGQGARDFTSRRSPFAAKWAIVPAKARTLMNIGLIYLARGEMSRRWITPAGFPSCAK